MAAALLLQEQRGFDVVGLDAADVVGLLQGATEAWRGQGWGWGSLRRLGTRHLAAQVLHQRDHGVFEERRRRQRSLGDLGDPQFALGPHDLHHRVGTGPRSDPTELKCVNESERFSLFSLKKPTQEVMKLHIYVSLESQTDFIKG